MFFGLDNEPIKKKLGKKKLIESWILFLEVTPLIFLSVSVSTASITLQFLTLRTLAEKEAYPSVFALIGALSKGEFLAGVNQIKKNTSSIKQKSLPFIP